MYNLCKDSITLKVTVFGIHEKYKMNCTNKRVRIKYDHGATEVNL